MQTKSKIFRLNQDQIEQIENYLASEKTNFTDLMHSLIERELMSKTPTVSKTLTNEIKERIKIKKQIEIIKRYQKTDPDLLIQLARIGNNINQIARALNAIQHASIEEQKNLNLLNLFMLLDGFHNQLSETLPSLPKISRQSPERFKTRFASLGD